MKYYLIEQKYLVHCPDNGIDEVWENGKWVSEFECEDKDFATRYEDYLHNSEFYTDENLVKSLTEQQVNELLNERRKQC